MSVGFYFEGIKGMRIAALLCLSAPFVASFLPQRRAFPHSRLILSVIDEAAVAASVSVDQIPKKSMAPIASTPTQELQSAVPPSLSEISATTPVVSSSPTPVPEPVQKATVVVPAPSPVVASPGGTVDFDLPVPVIAGGLLALFAVGTFAMRQRGDEEDEPAPVVTSATTTAAVDDVSIPYDAAARLAYDAWRADHNKGAFDSSKFAMFKVNYEKITVANMVAKKKARETKSKPKLQTLSSSADQ